MLFGAVVPEMYIASAYMAGYNKCVYSFTAKSTAAEDLIVQELRDQARGLHVLGHDPVDPVAGW